MDQAAARRESDGAPPLRVLFACTYNATRSPMAQALSRQLCGAGEVPPLVASSAGVYTGDSVDPIAIQVMAELGEDIAAHHPHSFADLEAQGEDLAEYDLVVALSAAAERRAADYLYGAETPVEHWDAPDLTAAEGSETTRLSAYRAARDALAARIRSRFAPH